MKFNTFDYTDFDLELLQAETLPEEGAYFFRKVWEEINRNFQSGLSERQKKAFTERYGGY